MVRSNPLLRVVRPVRPAPQAPGDSISRRRAHAALLRVINCGETSFSLARIALEAGDIERAARHIFDPALELSSDLDVVGDIARSWVTLKRRK